MMHARGEATGARRRLEDGGNKWHTLTPTMTFMSRVNSRCTVAWARRSAREANMMTSVGSQVVVVPQSVQNLGRDLVGTAEVAPRESKRVHHPHVTPLSMCVWPARPSAQSKLGKDLIRDRPR